MDREKNSFTKAERLCSKKLFAELFDSGNSFYSFPFRIVWTYSPSIPSSPSQVAVSVPKRAFKKAVDRNLIKRRIKESFRKNKHEFYSFLEKNEIKIVFVLIYKENQIPEYSDIEKAIEKLLRKFTEILKGKQMLNIS